MGDFSIEIDDLDVRIGCAGDDTVLRAALRAGVAFPYECNSGGCGSCKFELISGAVDNLWEDAPGRSLRDVKRGRLLACQCVPTRDCRIKVRLSVDESIAIRPRRRKALLTEIVPLTPDMSEFCFQDDAPAQFLPGQYVLMDLPGVTGSRGYSMSNLPNQHGEWRFIVKRAVAGKGTTYLFDELKPGERVSFDGPYGLAYLRPDVARDIVCIGGGSGLSPMLSIAAAAVREPSLNDRNVLLFYGGRGPADICTPKLISRDKELAERVTCYNAISDPLKNRDGAWDGACCFIHELVASELDSLPQYEFYFCGPPPMTDAIARMLVLEHQVPTGHMHFDRFY